MNIKRGDIFYADLSPVIGSEQGGVRPVLIVQNDVGNRFSPTVIAAAITSQHSKANLPTHILLRASGSRRGFLPSSSGRIRRRPERTDPPENLPLQKIPALRNDRYSEF